MCGYVSGISADVLSAGGDGGRAAADFEYPRGIFWMFGVRADRSGGFHFQYLASGQVGSKILVRLFYMSLMARSVTHLKNFESGFSV